MENKVVWVDIHVKNFDRAKKFYSAIFGYELIAEEYEQMRFAPFHRENMSKNKEDHKVSGCIVEDHNHKPANGNPLIYLNADGRLDEVLLKVKELGGEVVADKEQIGPWGYRAIIKDNDGNMIALHSFS